MKHFLIATVAVLTTWGAHADQLDEHLRNRENMVGAVVTLTTTPPRCHIIKGLFDGDKTARFIISYGHNPDAAFMDEVKARMDMVDAQWNAVTNQAAKTKAAEMVCAYAMVLSAKVLDRS
jgi:hypothetical protein